MNKLKFNVEDLLIEMTPQDVDGRFFYRGVMWDEKGEHYERYTIRFYHPYVADGQSPRLFHPRQGMSVIGAIRIDLPFITFIAWRKAEKGWTVNYDIPPIKVNICTDPPSDITKALCRVLNGPKDNNKSGDKYDAYGISLVAIEKSHDPGEPGVRR